MLSAAKHLHGAISEAIVMGKGVLVAEAGDFSKMVLYNKTRPTAPAAQPKSQGEQRFRYGELPLHAHEPDCQPTLDASDLDRALTQGNRVNAHSGTISNGHRRLPARYPPQSVSYDGLARAETQRVCREQARPQCCLRTWNRRVAEMVARRGVQPISIPPSYRQGHQP